MVEHNEDGALGIWLNRPTDLPLLDALPDWAGLASEPAVLHVGGPVEERSGWCLARPRHPDVIEGFVPIVGDLGLLDLEHDPDELHSALRSLRLYAGYSGWGAGQLDAELEQDAWFVVDAAPDDPSLPDGTALWRRILARPDGTISRLALFPPPPSLN